MEKISTEQLRLIMERLKANQNRKSTQANYLGIWRVFNKFLLKLEEVPLSWNDRISSFGAYLVDKGYQSSTLRSYVSAIKNILNTDGIELEDDKIMLGTLVKACKLQNDTVYTRLPIRIKLLEQLIFELERVFSTPENNQPYLELLYKSMLLLAYYGLFRVGEIASGDHCILARNVQVGQNKNKILITLESSKTHGKETRPQTVKISTLSKYRSSKRFFCPFRAMRAYGKIRPEYASDNEQFFVFSDGSPVTPNHIRTVLKGLLKRLNHDPNLYDMHSMRIGMASDMLKQGYTVEQIRFAGRWRSNAVFKYLRSY